MGKSKGNAGHNDLCGLFTARLSELRHQKCAKHSSDFFNGPLSEIV
jgi:hypothetical protein